jgi:hypothetical protein
MIHIISLFSFLLFIVYHSDAARIVACCGDSFTYGVEASDITKTTYPRFLRHLIPHDNHEYHVFNYGSKGSPYFLCDR